MRQALTNNLRTSRRANCGVAEKARVLSERLVRQLYWCAPRLWQSVRVRRRHQTPPQRCTREDLNLHLSKLGVVPGALVLAHTQVTGLQFTDANGGGADALRNASVLLADLTQGVGEAGTLVMPTNPRNQNDFHKNGAPVIYDPARTPGAVGLLNEIFWRQRGTRRSRFPYNSLAARGRLAEELMDGNLHEDRPTPHGPDSGYYKLCQKDALVISIGVRLRDCLTLAHVVEETRPDWPIPDFFEERVYQVAEGAEMKTWTVRVRREAYARYCYCRQKMARDLVAAGVVREGKVGTLTVDWTRASDVYTFFWEKTASGHYPYFGTWLVRA